MKHVQSILLTVAIFAFFAIAAGNDTMAQSNDSLVLAKVGGKNITAADVNKVLDFQKAQLQEPPMDAETENMLKKRILDQLVDMEILKQEAARLGITVSDVEVENEIAGEIERFGGQENVNEYLEQRGLTMDMFRASMKDTLLIKKLGRKVTDGITPVSAEEARKYYNENRKSFELPEKVHAFHIMIRVDQNASEEEVKRAESKINEVYQKAKKPGADFQALAREYSEEPGVKESGGDLGIFERGRMVQPFEDTAFATPVGRISKPIRTVYGFHIIKVTEHKRAGVRKFDQVKDNVIEMLTKKKKEDAYQKYIDDLRAKAKIEYPNPIPD